MNNGTVFRLPQDAVTGVEPTVVRLASGPRGQFLASAENALLRVVAAELIAANRRFLPVVITGPSGSGKSHLLDSLAAAVTLSRERPAVLHTNGADFARTISRAMETDSLAEVRSQFDRCDYLFLDDLQDLESKPYAQHELVRLLDQMSEQATPVVLAARTDLAAFSDFLPALRSRLMEGLVAPLAPVPAASQRAFVRELAVQHGVELSALVIKSLLRPIEGRPVWPRELTLAFRRHLSLDPSGRVTTPVAESLSPTSVVRRSSLAEFKPVLSVISRHLGLKITDLSGQSRRKTAAYGRALAAFLGRQVTTATFKQIGEYLGGRDHSTIMSSARRIERDIGNDPSLLAVVEQLKSQILAAMTHFPADIES